MERVRKNDDPTLVVTYITDPLCCWSYGMQPHIDALQKHFADAMVIRYVMGGMLPSWNTFHDETNHVSRPVQMGPVWMHAAQLTGRPIHHQLWIKDAPASSYPACMAVKCADNQDAAAGIALFKKLQQAVMEDGKNIATWKVIEEAAKALQQEDPCFDLATFSAAYSQNGGMNAFKDDLAIVAQYRINRFPSLLVQAKGQKGILIPGYRTVEYLLSVIAEAFPTS